MLFVCALQNNMPQSTLHIETFLPLFLFSFETYELADEYIKSFFL